TQMLILALDEACSNMIKHACDDLEDKRIEVQSSMGAKGLRFRLPGFCTQADVPNIKPRDLLTPEPGGLGTHFISRIMDRVQFERDSASGDKVALVMEKALPDPAEVPDEA